MKKITAAFDGLKYAESTTAYAIQLAKQSNSHLVGVFLEDPTYRSFKISDLIPAEDRPFYSIEELSEKDKLKRIESVKRFEESCIAARIEFSIHHDHKIPINELLHESIYSDLLILNIDENLSNHYEEPPTAFIRNLLTDVQCPVLLVPSNYVPIQKIEILYDGEPSSVHAIKMFSYMLPIFKHLKSEVISVTLENSSSHVPDNRLMKEFMKRHFPTANYKVLKGWGEIEIPAYLKTQSYDTLIVLGAYRRSRVSRWFKESMADILMKELKLPLFIAHNK